mmetsp:Transcript_139294/g.445337  ORF Transcript_139294/g.445337 Transcript_139294/m.445337 type:complete len:204 (+) Transcript_139294:2344-2955(+)
MGTLAPEGVGTVQSRPLRGDVERGRATDHQPNGTPVPVVGHLPRATHQGFAVQEVRQINDVVVEQVALVLVVPRPGASSDADAEGGIIRIMPQGLSPRGVEFVRRGPLVLPADVHLKRRRDRILVRHVWTSHLFAYAAALSTEGRLLAVGPRPHRGVSGGPGLASAGTARGDGPVGKGLHELCRALAEVVASALQPSSGLQEL